MNKEGKILMIKELIANMQMDLLKLQAEGLEDSALYKEKLRLFVAAKDLLRDLRESE